LAHASKEAKSLDELKNCESKREYITTVQFRRDIKDYGLETAKKFVDKVYSFVDAFTTIFKQTYS
jgi:hypothetical protein